MAGGAARSGRENSGVIMKVYLDEDAQDGDFVTALLFRNVDALTSGDAKMNGRSDREQLEFAVRERRILFSHNVGDFSVLHIEYLQNEKEHAGIVLVGQRQFSIGEQTRRLLRLINALISEEMNNRLEYLSAWREIL